MAVDRRAVLRRLADAHPELRGVRWTVHLTNGEVLNVRGARNHDVDEGHIAFHLDTGDECKFIPGEWHAARRMPDYPEADLESILFWRWQFGFASQEDYLNQEAWLRRQPEWIEAAEAVTKTA